MASKYDKQLNKNLEKGLEQGAIALGQGLKSFFVSVGYGIKKLKQRKFLVLFFLSFLVPVAVRVNSDFFLDSKNIYLKIAYFLLLIAPLLYLFIISKLGGNKFDSKRFDEGFKLMNFIGLDEKIPRLVNEKRHDNGIVEYYFKALIPLERWKRQLPDIETALNLTIIRLQQGDDKQQIYIKAVDGAAKTKEILPWDDSYIRNKDGVVVLGQTATDEIMFDFNKTPHMLSAGETGSGKSVIIRTVLWQLLNQGCKCIMIDFKGGIEFGLDYEEIGEVVTEVDRAAEVFEELVKENSKRMKLIRENRVKNIDEFNRLPDVEKFQRIGVFVDEMAQLMDSKGADKETAAKLKKIEGNVATLARLSRATGINLILGLQRPDANVLPGQIKNNIPVRVCGRFADKSASEIVLNNTRATTLAEGKGRFLFKVGADTLEFQSYFFEDDKHFGVDKLEENREKLASGESLGKQEEQKNKESVIKKIIKAIRKIIVSKYKEHEDKKSKAKDKLKDHKEIKEKREDKVLKSEGETKVANNKEIEKKLEKIKVKIVKKEIEENEMKVEKIETKTEEIETKVAKNETKIEESNQSDAEKRKALMKEKLKSKVKF